MGLFLVIGAFVLAVAALVVLGRLSIGRAWLVALTAFLVGSGAIALYAWLMSIAPDAGVTLGARVQASAMAAIVVALLAGYYVAAGRHLKRDVVVASMMIGMSLPFVAFGLVAGALAVDSAIECGPNSYECPL